MGEGCYGGGGDGSKTLRDLRIAEVVEMDLQIEDGKVRAFRTKIKLSFKYDKKG